MTTDLDEFNAFASQLEYPMYVVTAAAGGRRDGCLVGFATQCSIHPPRFLVCLSVKNRTFRIAETASVLAVHLVAEDLREPRAERIVEPDEGVGEDADKDLVAELVDDGDDDISAEEAAVHIDEAP